MRKNETATIEIPYGYRVTGTLRKNVEPADRFFVGRTTATLRSYASDKLPVVVVDVETGHPSVILHVVGDRIARPFLDARGSTMHPVQISERADASDVCKDVMLFLHRFGTPDARPDHREERDNRRSHNRDNLVIRSKDDKERRAAAAAKDAARRLCLIDGHLHRLDCDVMVVGCKDRRSVVGFYTEGGRVRQDVAGEGPVISLLRATSYETPFVRGATGLLSERLDDRIVSVALWIVDAATRMDDRSLAKASIAYLENGQRDGEAVLAELTAFRRHALLEQAKETCAARRSLLTEIVWSLVPLDFAR